MDADAIRRAVEPALRALRSEVLEVWRAGTAVVDRKADGTFVTALDKTIEHRLSTVLLDLDPTWGVRGEEGGVYREGTPTWYVDPLDGTLNFLRRIPLFAVQLALVDGDDPRFAFLYDPLQDEIVWAAAGEGAWVGNERLRVSQRPLDETVLLADVSSSGMFVQQPDVMARLRRGVLRMRSLGSVGIHLREVAAGRAEAYVASRAWPSNRHDYAPGALCVREAGGLVTTFEGGDVFADARTLLAAPPQVHAYLRQLLASSR